MDCRLQFEKYVSDYTSIILLSSQHIFRRCHHVWSLLSPSSSPRVFHHPAWCIHFLISLTVGLSIRMGSTRGERLGVFCSAISPAPKQCLKHRQFAQEYWSKEWMDEWSTGSWLDKTVDKSHPSGGSAACLSGKRSSVPNTLSF